MLGLRSQIIQSDDIQAVASWYETALQTAPYFQNENYIGFDVWGFELGIFKRSAEYIESWNNIEIYWWVDDVSFELSRLIELWATMHNPIEDVGAGITMASVKDPFGNIFWLIHNPNF